MDQIGGLFGDFFFKNIFVLWSEFECHFVAFVVCKCAKCLTFADSPTFLYAPRKHWPTIRCEGPSVLLTIFTIVYIQKTGSGLVFGEGT